MTVRAAVLVRPGSIAFEDRAEPVPEPHEVVVAVGSVGVCGSDVHYYQHGRIGDFVVEAPLILGHEAGGTITAIGSGVDPARLGERVAIEPGVPDGTCPACLAGLYNLCPAVRFLATPPIDGAFVQRLAIAATFAHPVPDGLSDDSAALIEPLSVGIAACRRAGVGIGSSVLITGAGPIGIVTAWVAAAAGAGRVVLSDIDEHRRERAVRLTTAEVVDAASLPAGLVVDAFIECSGAAAAAASGFAALGPAGRAVMVGMGGDTLAVPMARLQTRELTVTGAFRYANTYPAAIRLATSGAIDLNALVDRRYPLDQAEAALDAAHADPTVLKAIVRVGPEG